MARIPPEELERLKAEVSVEQLVTASGVDLKAAGKDLLGRCPFHEDREASLVVTPGKNLWHCFSCQIGGGPIDWVMKSRSVSFRHAVELLRSGSDAPAAPSSRGNRILPAPIHFDAGDQIRHRFAGAGGRFDYRHAAGLAQRPRTEPRSLAVSQRGRALEIGEAKRARAVAAIVSAKERK